MKIEYKRLDDLVPYSRNPRDTRAAVDKVAASIQAFGFLVPIIVDKDNVIVAGHTRLLAARKLGLKEVPVTYADDLSDDQIKAFRLVDNRVAEMAIWDLPLLAEALDDIGDEIDMSAFGFESVAPDEYEMKDTGKEFNEDDFEVVIAENVKGLVSGKAKGYVNEILKAFRDAGYEPQMFLLNAAFMGVPQARERVFFICRRKDLKLPKLSMGFHEKPILFGAVRSEHGRPLGEDTESRFCLEHRKPGDRRMSDIKLRLFGRMSSFNDYIWSDDRVCGTIASGGTYYRMCDGEKMSRNDYINVQTFPQDYDFLDQSPHYVCGMSVPPVMMARIAHEVDVQLLRGGVNGER